MAAAMNVPDFSAVILAAGTAARMDGIDKASLEHAGRTLLEHAIEAVIDAREVVVLGDPVPTTRPATFTREDPRDGGPAAGLLTGIDAFAFPARQVVVLAVDMPFVTASTVSRICAAADGHDGAMLVDGSGRRQLAGVLSVAMLQAVRPDLEHQHGMAVRRLLEPFDLADVPALGEEARDIDTWKDLRDLAPDAPNS